MASIDQISYAINYNSWHILISCRITYQREKIELCVFQIMEITQSEWLRQRGEPRRRFQWRRVKPSQHEIDNLGWRIHCQQERFGVPRSSTTAWYGALKSTSNNSSHCLYHPLHLLTHLQLYKCLRQSAQGLHSCGTPILLINSVLSMVTGLQ